MDMVNVNMGEKKVKGQKGTQSGSLENEVFD